MNWVKLFIGIGCMVGGVMLIVYLPNILGGILGGTLIGLSLGISTYRAKEKKE